jgi:hypothetical protein
MGAPVLHDGGSGEEIVGIELFGTANCDGPSGASRIDASAAFLDQHVGPIDPGEPDAGVPPVDSGSGDGGDDDDGGGCGVARSGGAVAWLVAVLGLLGLAGRPHRSRRRRRPSGGRR